MGKPARQPRSSWARTPFSTLGMNCRGTAPPTTLSTNSKPPPRGSGSTVMSQTAYWPWPPLCLTCRPWPVARRDERLPQRHPQRHGLDRHAVALAQPVEQHVDVGLAHRPQHDLVGLGVVLQPHRRVLGDQPLQRAGQLVLVGLGRRRGSPPAAAARAAPTARRRRGSPCCSACRSSRRGTAWRPRTRSPAIASGLGRSVSPERGGQRPTRSSSSWSSWPSTSCPANPARWPDTCTTVSGRSVPENTRTRLTRPTYASVVVRTTSATSGPSGSHCSGGERPPGRGHRGRQRVHRRRRERRGEQVQQLAEPDAGRRWTTGRTG